MVENRGLFDRERVRFFIIFVWFFGSVVMVLYVSFLIYYVYGFIKIKNLKSNRFIDMWKSD